MSGFGPAQGADQATLTTQTAAAGAVADAAVYVKGTASTDTTVAMLKGLLDMMSGAAGIPTWPASAAPGNGVSLAEGVRHIYDLTGVGSSFWLKKTLTSSAILTTTVDVTGVSSGGELAIVDVIVKSDATGLAGMTNFELETNNTNGLADFYVTIASGLNANKTVDLAGASVTKIKTVLESGKKVVARASGSNGTGAGTVDVYIRFERLAAAATIAAA
jgi:hypothetical protein